MRHLWGLIRPAAVWHRAMWHTAGSLALITLGSAAALAVTPSVFQEGEQYIAARAAEVRTSPGGDAVARLQAGASVELLARDRDWVRVRLEGWVREGDLVPADTALRRLMSAADLRADPDGTRGKIVQWRVEFLAMQSADPLRKGMGENEPYMLARGPGNENAILYLVVPPSLLSTARALQPLSRLAVTARVRDGRSEPAGIPILDLQSIRRVK
jgi:hypothetical protein